MWSVKARSTRVGPFILVLLTTPNAAGAQLSSAFDGMPCWSPDGQWIAFHSDRAGNFDIWLMDSDGGQLTQLTTSRGHDMMPRWSSDGQRILFYSDRDGNVFIDHNDLELFVMNADGSVQEPLTDNPARDMLGDWSPDAGSVAFVSDRDGPYDLFLMTLGQAPVNLTGSSTEVFNPAFAPDGAWLTFDAPTVEGRYDVFKTRIDGTGTTNLSRDARGHDFNARWSPDGDRIAFMSSRDGNLEIYVMSADGTGQVRLTTHEAGDHDPSWSPDGQKIVFMSRRDGNPEIYVMNTNGSQQRRLTYF